MVTDTSISSESEREDENFLNIKGTSEEATSSKTITYSRGKPQQLPGVIKGGHR
jgi:hypothetical protein